MKKFFVTFLIFLCLVAAVAGLAFAPWPVLAGLLLVFVAWLALTRRGRQTWSVTRVGISTLPQRLGSSSVVVVGIAGVVGVFVALLAMSEGFQTTLRQTGNEETVIVMRDGAQAELNSVLMHDVAVLVTQMPQVLKNAAGRPIASPELVVVASQPKKATGMDANLEVRGIGEDAWELRPGVRIIEGRKFNPGLLEIIVGKGARQQFAGLDIGATLKLRGQVWTIVGVFDSGDAHNSEVWGDAQVLGSAYRRGSSVTSVTVKLTSPQALDAFKAALAADPRLRVDAKTTLAYYNEQSEMLAAFIRYLGIAIGVVMGVGALFGALNTMYAAVSTRAREIATLRAIGFRSAPVVISVLVETMLLAALGGLVGAGITWAIFDNYTVSTMGSNFSQVVFAFQVSPELLGSGLKWALAIGLGGGLFPAVRAATVPVTTGLREL